MKKAILFPVLAILLLIAFAIPHWKQARLSRKVDDFLEKEYGSLGKTTDEILSHENGTNSDKIFGALLYRVGQKAESRGEQSLTDTERKFLAAYWVEAEVNNGGFDQYFFNSSGDNAEVALAGLKEMGATNAAALLTRAMAVFPDGKPPANRTQRQKVMDQIANQSKPLWNQCDDEFYKRNENIGELSLAYAKKRKSDILLP